MANGNLSAELNSTASASLRGALSGSVRYIQGPAGEGGYYLPKVDDGVLSWIPSSASLPAAESANVMGPAGRDGRDGRDGADGAKGDRGEPGAAGKDGYTPIKGVDYWTSADKNEMREYVLDTFREEDLPEIDNAISHLEDKALAINITVHGGTSAPSDASEGDIWVNTSKPITSWTYYAAEPANRAEGKVWLQASAGIAIDTLVNGNIAIYPSAAKQYAGGAWADVEGKIYRGGEWVTIEPPYIFLYNNGDECVAVSGGFASHAYKPNGISSSSVIAPTLTKKADSMVVSLASYYYGAVFNETAFAIDDISTIEVMYSSASGSGLSFLVTKTSGQNYVAAAKTTPESSSGTAVIDVSDLVGNYYFAIEIAGSGGSVTIHEIRLSKEASGGSVQPGGGGGGEISEEVIEQAVKNYLEENPIEGLVPTVLDYGAKGDGATDDTAAFQTALAENRVVLVPGGTYKLSDTLAIDENCCLELSQDTVLQFTQTNKNSIEMRRLANLKGNRATIFVPYTFSANVIHAATDVDSAGGNNANVPPFTKWDPQWKYSRYVTDINICKPDSRGFLYSLNGDCYGKAVYIKCDKDDPTTFMWGVDMSGLRIAGGFSYGVHIENIGETAKCWNHDMRIEAVIDGCETGVCIENCHNVHLAAAIQPRRAYSMSEVETPYAKWGIKLVDSHNVDLSQSFVWDWHLARQDSEEYTHIAMYGNCYGVVLNEPRYYESSTDVRDSIYTDTPSNLEKMTILQEPITRWFKPVDNKPYFFDGNGNKQLAMKSDVDEYFITDRIAQFTNVLENNIDKNGNIYGTASGYYNSNFTELTVDAQPYHVHTGFIACKKGDVFITDGIGLREDGCVRVAFFDADFNFITNVNGGIMMTGNYYVSYEALATGFKLTINNINDGNVNKIAYARFNFNVLDMGVNPVMSVNDDIKFTQTGFLADGIKVKGENIIGNTVLTSPGGKKFVLTVSDSGTLSATAVN